MTNDEKRELAGVLRRKSDEYAKQGLLIASHGCFNEALRLEAEIDQEAGGTEKRP